MAEDHQDGMSMGASGPAERAEPITPDDDNDLPFQTRAIYVGVAGDVSLVPRVGDAVTFTAVPAGTVLPVRADRVRATGTTATNLVALA